MRVEDWFLLAGGVALLGAMIYWLLFLTEGAYLGKRVVIRLYDAYARRYDSIKDWSMDEEVMYVAEPFAREVGTQRQPVLILDAAAGTGRMVRAVRKAGLMPDATWVLLDGSAKMLAEARRHLSPSDHIYYLHHAMPSLPFPDDMFDVITCMEALEFIPQPEQALAELVRVLRPGGYLLITNRVGWIARLMPGRTWTSSKLFRLLKELNQRQIAIRPFLTDYQWVSSLKAGSYQGLGRDNGQNRIAHLEEVAKFEYNKG